MYLWLGLCSRPHWMPQYFPDTGEHTVLPRSLGFERKRQGRKGREDVDKMEGKREEREKTCVK